MKVALCHTKTLARLTALLAACILAPACVDEAPTVESTELASGITLDFCPSATPDDTLTVTASTSTSTYESKSGSGAYFYEATDACYRWILDVRVAADALDNEELLIDGRSYDLPSSAQAGGAVPGTPEDCARWSESVTFYSKLAGQSAFTKVKHRTVKGTWGSGTCTPYLASGTDLEPLTVSSGPASGWDTYRVVVGTKLRSTWQEVVARVVRNGVPL